MIAHSPGISVYGLEVLQSVISQGLGSELSPANGTTLVVDAMGIVAETGGSPQYWPGRLSGTVSGMGLLGFVADRFHLPVVDALEAALAGEPSSVRCLGLMFDHSTRRITLTFTPVRDGSSGEVLGAIIRALEDPVQD